MVDNERFRVEVDVGGSSRKILLLAPKGLNLAAAARAFKDFSRAPEVQRELMHLGKDCFVQMITTMPVKGPPEIVGVSVSDCEEA